MAKTFAEAIKKNKQVLGVQKNSVIRARIISVIKHAGDEVFLLDAGLKLEGIVKVNEFTTKPEIGDFVDVIIVGEKDGKYLTSHQKAKREKALKIVRRAKENKSPVAARIVKVLSEEYEVLICDSFLTKVKKTGDFKEDEEVKVFINEMNNNNIDASLSQIELKTVKEGDIVECIVKHFNDFFVFVEIAGVDMEQLIHIKDLSDKFVAFPGDAVKVGDKITAKVLRVSNRVFLGVKQLEEKKWSSKVEELEVNGTYEGIVRSIKNFGIVVRVNDMEGFVSAKDLSWATRNPAEQLKKFHVGQKVKVKLLSTDLEKEKILLSIKETEQHPFFSYTEQHTVGEVIDCDIVTKYETYAFLSIAPGLDGILYSSEMDWDPTKSTEEFQKLEIGKKLKVKISMFNREKRGVILSVKRLSIDPANADLSKFTVGENYECIISSIRQNGVIANPVISDKMTCFISFNDLNRDAAMFRVGGKLNAKLIESTPEKGLKMSVRAYRRDMYEERERNIKTTSSTFADFME